MEKISIQKITIHSWFNLAEEDYPYETYEFNIDFEKNKAYFDEKKIYDFSIISMPFKENRDIFNKIHEYYSEEEFELNKIDMNELISSIADLKRYCEGDSNLDSNLAKVVFYTINIRYSNQESDHIKCYTAFPIELINFSNVIKKLVGFDVFNIDSLKGLVTDYNYDIAENYIADKVTGEKLVLKKLYFSKECGALFKSTTHEFKIDFDKNELKTFDDNVIILTSKNTDDIISLIKKYGIFKWNSVEYSNKAMYEYSACLDGCSWRLSLAFDGGQVLNVGGSNNYHDTYVEFGNGLKNLFGMDLLDISDVPY